MSYIGFFIIFAGLLFYFGVDVRGFVDSHAGVKDVLIEWKDKAFVFYKAWIYPVLSYIWNDVWLETIWKNIKRLIVPVE